MGRSGSEKVRICLILNEYCSVLMRKDQILSVCIIAKTIREPAAVHRPGVLKALKRTNIQDTGQWGKGSSRPTGEVNTGDEHVEAALIAEAWSHAVLTVRLAIMALGSSVQREEKNVKKR